MQARRERLDRRIGRDVAGLQIQDRSNGVSIVDWPKNGVYLMHLSKNVARVFSMKIDRNLADVKIKGNFVRVITHC